VSGISASLPRLPRWQTQALVCAGFFLLAFVVYGWSLGNTFVMWDDNLLITGNPDVRGFSLHRIWRAFSTFDPELYVPLTILSYQLDYTLGGLHPFIFHFTNLILHTFNGLFVAWLLYLLSSRPRLALFAGLLFLVHPLNTEAVVWASARKDLLSTFFFLLSIIGYVYHSDSGNKRMYGLSVAAFLLALLSKVSIVLGPVLLFFIDWYRGRRIDRRMILEKMPYFALSAVFGIIAIFGKTQVVAATTTFQKILMAFKSTMFYLEKWIAPVELAPLYPYDKPIAATPDFLIPMAAVSILIIIIVASLKWTRAIAFCAAFFALMVIPSFTNFAKGGESYVASDRYAYVPSIGLFLLLILVAGEVSRRIADSLDDRRIRGAGTALGIVMVCGFSLLAYKQSLVWRGTDTMFEHTLRHYPDAIAAKINLGVTYRIGGQYEKAMEILDLAIRQRPHSRAYTAKAAIYMLENDYDKAIEMCNLARQTDPKDPDPLYGLGLAYQKKDDPEKAKAMFLETLTMAPDHGGAMNNHASILFAEGKLDEAEAYYRKAITVMPHVADPYYNVAIIREQREDFAEAAKLLEKVTEIEGDKPQVLQRLASAYAQINDTNATERTLKRLLAVDPGNSFARQMLDAMKWSGLSQ